MLTTSLPGSRTSANNRPEDQRAKVARETEEQRAQDAALQTYLDVMGDLLLTEDLDPLDEDSAARRRTARYAH